MDKRVRILNIISLIVLGFYILFLIKILLLSRFSLLEIFDSQREMNRSLNLIPFSTISEFIFDSDANVQRFSFVNLIGNILIFIPLGYYLSLFRDRVGILINLLPIVCITILVEIVQWVFGIGTADIDDILLNVLGGFIGILMYQFFSLILRSELKIKVFSAIISIAVLPALLYYLFVIQLKL